MTLAARVLVLQDGLVVNDPNHRAIKCAAGATVIIAGDWYADSLVASGLVERVAADAPAHLLYSLEESEAMLASLTPQDFTTPSGQPNKPADLGEAVVDFKIMNALSNVPAEATEQPQEREKPPTTATTGAQLPGRISEVEAVRKRAGSKAK